MRHRVTRLLAGIIGIEALIVVAGWAFDIERLTRIGPFDLSINMKFVTAVLFFFSAIGLYLMSRIVQDASEVALVALPGVSLVIFLITIALFVGRLLGTPTGIEYLFLHSSGPVDFSGTLSMEGWPALPTLLNFMLVGLIGIVSLFTGTLREKYLKYTGYFILSTGIIAVAGYVFGLHALYYEFGISTVPMALNTALSFILLGFGLTQVYRPEAKQ